MGQYADRTLVCRDCGKEFAFSTGEQEFYASRGLNEPTRCSDCRAARKAGRDGGDFGRGRSQGGESRYEARSGGARSQAGTRPMFKATCADCGATTEVPFEPRQGRPVYCRDCFEKRNPRR